MLPYADPPGRDVGITGDDYAWLLRQCKVKADWQLNFRISFGGRLTKRPQPKFEYRGKPDYSYALGRMPYMGDGRSLGGQTTAGDYIYTRTHPLLHRLSILVDLPSTTFARGRGHSAKNQNGSSTSASASGAA